MNHVLCLLDSVGTWLGFICQYVCVCLMFSYQWLTIIDLTSEWLLVLEDQGVRVFDHLNSKFRARDIISKSGAEFLQPDGKNNPDVSFPNSVTNAMDEDPSVGDFDMVDSVATAAAQGTSITLTANGIENGRKRKDCMNDKGDMRIKFLRQHLHDSPLREKSLPLVWFRNPSLSDANMKLYIYIYIDCL